MSNWYDNFTNFDVSKVATKSTGMDYFLSDTIEADERFHDMRHATIADEMPDQMRVASVDQLSGFTRVANTNTLVRKSEQDLWSLKEGDDGEFLIERLFDETGNPLKV